MYIICVGNYPFIDYLAKGCTYTIGGATHFPLTADISKAKKFRTRKAVEKEVNKIYGHTIQGLVYIEEV